MPTSDTAIANQALSHLGHSTEIADLNTERSNAASACRRFYESTRDEVLAAFPWPFATRFETLPVLATQPTGEWLYSYRAPADVLAMRRIVPPQRDNTALGRIPFRLLADDTGVILYSDYTSSDLGGVQVEYTVGVTDPTQFPPLFVAALGFLLAFKIAPRVTQGDLAKLGDRAYQAYLRALSLAQASALNEEAPDLGDTTPSSFDSARQ